jgi:hypothetical protein
MHFPSLDIQFYSRVTLTSSIPASTRLAVPASAASQYRKLARHLFVIIISNDSQTHQQ